jgi:hypothetical protein
VSEAVGGLAQCPIKMPWIGENGHVPEGGEVKPHLVSHHPIWRRAAEHDGPTPRQRLAA